MNISDFERPHEHPFNTFGSYEKEAFMRWFLLRCFDANDLNAVVSTPENEDGMVAEGFLQKAGDRKYRLTSKSKGILFSVYGKG